jgi:uncharacterized membrane protein
MNWYLIIKFLHIIAVIMMIGGVFARQLVRGVAKKSDDIKLIAILTQIARRLDTTMIIPGSNAALLLGIPLAFIAKIPMFGFLQGASTNWLLASNILLVFVLVVIFGLFVPHNKKLDAILKISLAKDQVTSELRAAMDDGTLAIAHHFEEAAIIIIVALMVLKPF